MNNKLHQEALKQATKSKFRGHTALKSKTIPLYPSSAEREFRKISTGYMKVLKHRLVEHLPKMMEIYKRDRRNDSRFDDFRDIETLIRQEIMKIAAEMEQDLSSYDVDSLVKKVAQMTKKTSYRAWKRSVRETLGISLIDDYYSGAFYQSILQQWVDDSVLKIKSIPTNTLLSMEKIILAGFKNGLTIRDISKEIQETYDVSKHKAQAIARDQVGTLNAQITRRQQEDAGCEEYIWSDSDDSRVRDCHRALDGQTFRWDNPPEMWYMTKKGIVYTGRRCNPGEDYACRCVAIPKFNIETLDLPFKELEKEAKNLNGNERTH